MKRLSMIAAAFAVAFTAGVADAGPHDKAIKARKAQMVLYAFNISTLGAMAKGKVAYDAKAAQAAANNLAALSNLAAGAMWPPGSDSTAMPGKTAAKKEIWTTFPKIIEASKAMSKASANMAAEAGKGLDALRGAIGALGASCGGCHKPFREPKK